MELRPGRAPVSHTRERTTVDFPPPLQYTPPLAGSSTPIVIDNGASSLRAGWATQSTPYIERDSLTAKYRERKGNRPIILVGQDAHADASSKANLRMAYEGDVLCSQEAMENMLDYVFLNLGLNDTTVVHPIAMTETLCAPQYSRTVMSELLFECYSAPSVSYAVDSLASFYTTDARDGLIISSSTSSTHILPVLDGRGILANTKRLNWGGATATDYLLKLVQLKYPNFPLRVTPSQAEDMMHEHCYLSLDYPAELGALADPVRIVGMDRIIQFPFSAAMAEEKTADELARQLERRREAGKRLQEQQAQARQEKLAEKEQDLGMWLEIREAKSTMLNAVYLQRLEQEGFPTEEEFNKAIAKTEKTLKRARNKDAGIEEEVDKEPPSFPLIDVPDHTLDEETLKEKRRQKLMKAGYDARVRLKAEKDAEKAKIAAAMQADLDKRTADPSAWATDIRAEREACLQRIADRSKRRSALTDRKSVAAQSRMKSIATLASDVPVQKRKRKKGGEDTFGADDNDWAVYRTIVGADDSEDEEDDQALLVDLEGRLLEHDPTFTAYDTAERTAQRRNRLLNAYLRGDAPETAEANRHDPSSAEHSAQLHLNVERIRVPEALYQPLTAGVDQAGLLELIETVLRNFSPSERDRLTGNIFVTGGHSQVANFDARLHASMRSVLPVGAPLRVGRPADVRLAAWQGLAKWSRTDDFRAAGITLADYLEQGPEYRLDRHALMPSLVGM